MRRVAQRLKMDCGIAAVAMVANITYEQSLATFYKVHKKRNFNTYGTTTQDLIEMLKLLGHKPDKRLKRKRTGIAIAKAWDVGVSHRGNWHWLAVSKNGKVYNSVKINPAYYDITTYLNINT